MDSFGAAASMQTQSDYPEGNPIQDANHPARRQHPVGFWLGYVLGSISQANGLDGIQLGRSRALVRATEAHGPTGPAAGSAGRCNTLTTRTGVIAGSASGGGGGRRAGDQGGRSGRMPARRDNRPPPADESFDGEGRNPDGSVRHAGGVQGQARGRDALRAGNSAIDRVTNEFRLTSRQREQLHQDVHYDNLSYDGMRQRALELWPHLATPAPSRSAPRSRHDMDDEDE